MSVTRLAASSSSSASAGRLVTTAGAALLLAPVLAYAEPAQDAGIGQTAEAGAAARQPSTSENVITLEEDKPLLNTPRRPPVTLEEIVVTAQKRPQALGDVPISVTAVDGAKLQDSGIENLTDLSEYAPNFKLVDSGLIPNVYMRGVGSGSNQGFELSVGIFADGIHLGRPHQSRAAFMDVERVEVLRGPQSILFGKNAIAGALNIISARPGSETEAQLSGALGLLADDTEMAAVLSGPLTSWLGARLALRQRGEQGDLENPLQERKEPGVDEQAARLTLDLWPDGDWSSSLKLERTRREQRGRRFQTTAPGSLTRCTGEDVRLDRAKVTDAREVARIEAFNITLSTDKELADGELSLVSGYNGFDSSDLFDADSSSLDTLALLGEERYRQFSQEIRYAASTVGVLDYTVGAFFQRGDLNFYEFGPTKARAGALSDSPSCDANLEVIAAADLERDFRIDGDAWSLFAQTTFWWSHAWRTTLGLRYVHETKRGYRRFDIYEPGTRQQANPATLLALDRLLINEHELQRSREVSNLLPSVNLQFDWNDDVMHYLAYTQGAKSGSYDARNNNGNTDASGGATRFEFDDEVADAFELGSKLRLLQGAASLNLALYHVRYKDMQVSVYDGVAGFTVTNAGSALTQGLEIDGRWLFSESLSFNASLALLDFEWLDYVDGPCHANSDNVDPDTGTCDMTGKENQQTPKLTGSLSASYIHPMPNAHWLSLTLDASYRGRHYTSGDLDPRGTQNALARYNARLSYGPADDHWAIALVGKNLGDALSIGIGAPTSLDLGGYRVATESSRSLALEFRSRF